ncbi:MAG: ABC transporter permease subunit [Magnetococcales bacterium]|nr:ABC transporter permease subunit [Magnetococcales bacterium]MBF0438120.1 ABC transporter permease subunit [Magnetococcales bacterium]
MRGIITIALRELRGMFYSPLAWTLLAVLFAICAYMFNAGLLNYQIQMLEYQAYGMKGSLPLTERTIAPMLGNAAVLLLLLMPLLSMRLIAEEKRQGTWPALACSPLSPMAILLGKYLGLLMFLAITCILLAIPPLTLYAYGNPDTGQFLAGLLGLFLTAASFGAVGLAASSATDNPNVAAVASFGVLLMLWIISWMGNSSGGVMDQTLSYFSLMTHYQNFLTGMISSSDLLYFILLSSAGLLFARQRLLAERIQG